MEKQRLDCSGIEEEIYRAIRSVKPSLENLPLTPDTRFADLGLGSLDMATVVFEIEDNLAISIANTNLDTFRTIGEARNTVEKLIRKRDAEGAA